MSPANRPNPWLEIVITIVLPSLVLMQASGKAALGPTAALLLALAFPLGWGLNNLRNKQGFGPMAGIGVVSTLATGGMGLLQLDGSWFAVKEAGVSALFGVAVALSAFTRKPLVHALLLHPSVFDVPRLQAALAQRGAADAFAARMRRATLLFALTFAVSAALNYGLARWLVRSPSGSEAFNQELGRFTLIAWPVITVPSLALTMAVLWWIARSVRELAGLGFNDLLLGGHPPKA
jgi:hypothetical protein